MRIKLETPFDKLSLRELEILQEALDKHSQKWAMNDSGLAVENMLMQIDDSISFKLEKPCA